MDKPKYRVYLCSGPNCGPKGAGALLDFLSHEVERHQLESQVSVAATGCQAHCESGPTMVVFPGPTFYQGIDRERLVRIVSEHFVGGEPVKEFFWNGVRRRIIPGQPSPKPLPPAVRPNGHLQSKSMRPDKPRPKPPPREVDDFKW
jgi:(2Fe-2S) ferredoxin